MTNDEFLSLLPESNMTEPCPRAGRWIGGCKFEPRYDRQEPCDDSFALPAMFHQGQAAVEAIKSTVKRITYVRDVCVRCGQTIERAKT